jgi:hypothetical protein
MQDIKFRVEDVRRFQREIRTVGTDIGTIQTALRASLKEVSAYWRDDSLTIANRDIEEVTRKMQNAISQLDSAVGAAIKRQIEWAERYNRIR